MEDIKIKKAMSLDSFMKKKFKVMGFEGAWLHHLGDATKEGSWFITGKSGMGKSNYALKLAKYLSNFGRVAYNACEEADCSTLQASLNRVNMLPVGKRFLPLNQESFLELRLRLKQPKSHDIVFIDSIQTMFYDPNKTRRFSYTDYRTLIDEFPKKLFVMISKWEPSEKLVINIKHDSHIKIIVDTYYATIEATRYDNGGQAFDAWPDR